MEGRMTLCNMAIEACARMGFIAVVDVTINYLKGRLFAPTAQQRDAAVAYWCTLHSDEGAALIAFLICAPKTFSRRSPGELPQKWSRRSLTKCRACIAIHGAQSQYADQGY